jgi:hypothetical protein
MEQSHSWEANRFAASQEILRVLWNPKVHYRIRKCPPPVPMLNQLDPVHTPTSHFLKIGTKSHVPLSLLRSYQNISPGPRLCLWIFRNKIRFNREQLLTPCPTPKLEDHPLSAVRDCLLNTFAATPPYRKPFLHPQPKDASCRGDRYPPITWTILEDTVNV